MPIISGAPGSTGTVTTVSGGDASITVANPTTTPAIETADLATIASLHASAGSITASSQKIIDLATPTLATDAVTKGYTDAAINGLDWKQAARLATAAALPTNVYANGSSGVGATLVATAFGALTVDGVAVAVADRIVVKNEVAGANNGIYTVTATGGGAAFYTLTRALDFDQASEIVAGTGIYVTAGTANTDTSWVMTTTGVITVGTTSLTFTQFGAGQVTDVQDFQASGTWTMPTGAKFIEVVCVGSGGGGGGGFTGSGAANLSGGGGGGGGAVTRAVFKAADITSPVTVTVGTAGTAGQAGSPATDGGDGSTSSFGTYLKAGGGGGGRKGASATNTAGGAGGSPVASAVQSTAGNPRTAASGTAGIAGQAAHVSATNSAGDPTEWGGASGGGGAAGSNVGLNGGDSIFGGPGGGAAGGCSSTVGTNGVAGGKPGAYSTGSGPSGGTGGGTTTVGGPGTFVGPYTGSAGGGGGSGSTGVTAKAGGAGSIGAGGGGGGSSANTTGAAGGLGGVGRVLVTTW